MHSHEFNYIQFRDFLGVLFNVLFSQNSRNYMRGFLGYLIPGRECLFNQYSLQCWRTLENMLISSMCLEGRRRLLMQRRTRE